MKVMLAEKMTIIFLNKHNAIYYIPYTINKIIYNLYCTTDCTIYCLISFNFLTMLKTEKLIFYRISLLIWAIISL